MKSIWLFIQHKLDRLRCRDGHDLAKQFLDRQHFHSMGENCYVDFSVVIDEPYLVSMGSNVWLTDDVKLLTHDAAISMLSRATGQSLKKFGAIHLGDNVFVGMNSCIMPGVTIGNNCVVAAGSVVTSDVADGTIVGGNPARAIGTVDAYIQKWQQKQEPFNYTGSSDKESVLVASLMKGTA